jgi:hypothetical protein
LPSGALPYIVLGDFALVVAIQHVHHADFLSDTGESWPIGMYIMVRPRRAAMVRKMVRGGANGAEVGVLAVVEDEVRGLVLEGSCEGGEKGRAGIRAWRTAY